MKSEWLWSKCADRSLRSSSNRSSNDLVMNTSIAKCFLVPVWWGSSGVPSRVPHHDRLQKHLVLSHGVNGPSARIVLWKNYTGFDSAVVRKNLGSLIRAYCNKGHSEVDELENENQSLFGSILSKAVATYVNTQLEHCAELDVHVAGSNRDILGGQLKRVKILAKQVVYKGIAFSDVNLSANSIQIRLGRKRLLQNPLHVKAIVSIGEEDLKASLASPLMADCLTGILPEGFSKGDSLAGVEVSLQEGVVLLTGREPKHSYKGLHNIHSVALSFEIRNSGKMIYVSKLGDYKQADSDAHGKCFDVGSETSIQKLGVIGSKLVVGGEFYIIPA